MKESPLVKRVIWMGGRHGVLAFWLGLSALLFVLACDWLGPGDEPANVRNLVVMYTNDEHGWMEATENTGGAAGIVGLWKEKEGWVQDSSFLILSGGDMWTGPAISTWFQGESMAEVMNAMGYDAAAIGNHEFDFSVEGLRARLEQSDFPFLSANIREKTTGDIPDFATPYAIQEVNGVRVGLIGLTTTTTSTSAFPEYVADYDFIPYEDALEEVVPQVKAGGAELLIVLGHICHDEMRALAPAAADLGIAVIGGGHCHERVTDELDGVALIESGEHLKAYARVELTFDIEADTVVAMEASIHDNTGGSPDSAVAAVVACWRARADSALSEVIGYVEALIGQYSPAMHNMVTDSWLEAFPQADISATNRGGFGQDIPAGDITLGTIVGVLPFENVIVELDLTGTQLISYIEAAHPVVGGMTTIGGYARTNGTPIAADSTYLVLVTDYMYSSSSILPLYDSDPYYTSVSWREPVIEWIRVRNTAPGAPLDNYLDTVARQ